ncbi:MAG: hypothetical protein DGJ47_000522 [Rickettsiaceae bacterium]
MPKRILQGTVEKNSKDKTVLVRVLRTYMHPLYKKIVKSSKKYSAHDETNSCKEGEVVKIQETRPISKSKSWVVIN